MSESGTLHSQLLIGGLIKSPEVSQALAESLNAESFQLNFAVSEVNFLDWIGQNRHRVDCLVFEPAAAFLGLVASLQSRDIVLPTLIVAAEPLAVATERTSDPPEETVRDYHKAVVRVPQTALSEAERYIREAIAQFLKLPDSHATDAVTSAWEDTHYFLLSLQQQRLSEKLRERLGYLGVYYKRNPESFLRNLSLQEREHLLKKLQSAYRGIVLEYFATSSDTLNQKIDDFVNTAFFADISVSQIVEVHMELMDDFSKQLKLEGRSEEILLDYRLTLIDVIAHLCEMYRRSIPRDM